jgi:hypothetical protein
MTRRSVSESKADATHAAAMQIIDAEALHRRMKTIRLRELRLAQEAQARSTGASAPKAGKRKARA